MRGSARPDPMLPGPCAGRERGFSFIEVLVVMAIIGILAGLSVVIFGIWSKKGPVFHTEQRVRKLTLLAGTWKQKFNRLPPSDPTRIPTYAGPGRAKGAKLQPNSFNVPIESLVLCLYWDSFGTDPQIGDDELGNTDEDEADKAPTLQGTALREVVDAWGNPLVYFVGTDYARAAEAPPSYMTRDGREVQPKPWKYADESRGFAEPMGFQLFSMGPDGEPNTEDDIKSWE